MTPDPLELPFDQYQRYRLVADLLGTLRTDKKPLSVLDVGGRTAVLRSFLPHDKVFLVDVEPSREPGLVLGDGSRLPFADRSFDVVAAFDTLEHVPPPARAAFVAECARVARRWVVLAGPYRSPEVDEAETLLQRFLRDKLGVEHRYLDEHRHNGLPDMAATTAVLEKAGARTVAIGHGNLERWLPLMSLSLYLDHEPALRPLAKSLFRFYNGSLYASDHARPVYRHAVVGALAGAPLPTAAPGLEPPRAPAGALERFDEVIGELVAFDRARAAWNTERERLWEITRTLEQDLSGHRESLTQERKARTATESVLATLQKDLEGHRAALSAAHADVARHELAQTKERAAAALVRAELEKELALAQAALAASDREREDLRAQRVRLENDVDRLTAELKAVRADLGGHRTTLAAERAELASHRAALDTSRARAKSLEELVAAGQALAARQEGDLAREREAKQRESAALAEERLARTSAESILSEHRAVVRDLTADLEGHRAALRDTRAEAERLRTDLATAMHERNVEQQRLEGAHGELARVSRILQDQDRTIAALRADLRSRVKSLRRALGPKPPLP